VCCDVSNTHKIIAAQQAMSGSSLLSGRNRNRLVRSLENDGGAYLNNDIPYSYPKPARTPVPRDVLDFLDEVARCGVFDLPEPDPSNQLVYTVSPPFSNYGNFTAWAESFDAYWNRVLWWQIQRYGAEQLADYAPKSLAA
jgi:hypothetical protein